jgi:transcription antitermination factor NusG
VSSYLTENNFHYSTDDNIIVYCLFCRVGSEEEVANTINKQQQDNLLALPVLQEKHRSINGVRSIVVQVMLPGYVFVYSTGSIPMERILQNSKAMRFLSDTQGDYELYGYNLEYAKWLLNYKGLICCSKALRVGSRVQVVEGPLKDYEGHIKEISKKNRNGRIETKFMGQEISVWLPFEWVETDSDMML